MAKRAKKFRDNKGRLRIERKEIRAKKMALIKKKMEDYVNKEFDKATKE